MKLEMFVPGIPVAKGSARAFVNRRTGRAIVMQANAARQKPFASLITTMVYDKDYPRQHEGPVFVGMTFCFPRPRSHYRANGQHKDWVPRYHTVKPDVDKLVRLVLDALHPIWRDDCQCQVKWAFKLYTDDQPGVLIEVHI